MARILVADDHEEMGRLLAEQLGDLGHDVSVAVDGAAALLAAERELPDLVLSDLRMPGVDGLDVLAGVLRLDPTVPVIVMTAFGGVDTAVEAMRRGAFHYVTKPFRLDELALLIERALSDQRLRRANATLRRQVDAQTGPSALVGAAPSMREVLARIERAARVDVPVLVRGESGTGKELVARALHQASRRAEGPLVAVNCTALPSALLESELFGHGKGAFTGATGARRGLFAEADGGTLFLDEIGDMPIELQSRLLRVLEDGMIRPVGADRERKVDVRIVAATHQPLEERVREGKFREDLFYRLNVVPVVLPPLRERLDDLPALCERLLAQAAATWPDAPLRALSPELVAALARRAWPGNVRELRNTIQRLLVLVDGPVADVRHLALVDGGGPPVAPPSRATGATGLLEQARDERRTLKEVEDTYIGLVMEQCAGNKTQAARVLGVDPSTLYRWERGRAG